jgi:hypothetical protein
MACSPKTQDLAVQRVRGAGGAAVCRHGPEKVLLNMALSQLWRVACSQCGASLGQTLGFAAMSLPFGRLVWGAIFDQLGANPAEALIRASGDWTLRMLCLVLA